MEGERLERWEFLDQVAAILIKMRLILEGVFALYDGGILGFSDGVDEKRQKRLQRDTLEMGLFELRDLLNEMQAIELKNIIL